MTKYFEYYDNEFDEQREAIYEFYTWRRDEYTKNELYDTMPDETPYDETYDE